MKNEKRSNRGFFISKKYRKRFFRLFNYKRSLFFELPGLDKLLAQNAPKFLTWQRKPSETHPIFQAGTFSLVKKEKNH